MIRFFRLFAAFRNLEADRDSQVVELRDALQQMTTEKLVLQDRLDNVLNDRAELWQMTKEAINEERQTLKMMANYRIQSVYGVTPYPDAGQLPESAQANLDLDKVVPRRQFPSERVAAAKAQLVDRLVSDLTRER